MNCIAMTKGDAIYTPFCYTNTRVVHGMSGFCKLTPPHPTFTPPLACRNHMCEAVRAFYKEEASLWHALQHLKQAVVTRCTSGSTSGSASGELPYAQTHCGHVQCERSQRVAGRAGCRRVQRQPRADAAFARHFAQTERARATFEGSLAGPRSRRNARVCGRRRTTPFLTAIHSDAG